MIIIVIIINYVCTHRINIKEFILTKICKYIFIRNKAPKKV